MTQNQKTFSFSLAGVLITVLSLLITTFTLLRASDIKLLEVQVAANARMIEDVRNEDRDRIEAYRREQKLQHDLLDSRLERFELKLDKVLERK